MPSDLMAYAGFMPSGPLLRSMLANNLTAYAGFMPNGKAFVPNHLTAYDGLRAQ